MAEEGMKIRVGADVTQAVAGLDRVNTSLKKFSAGANQTRTSMVNLSRVIQDAPFGIIGIANNIDPLINSFQQLSKETGGTGKALKSMAASMLGPAGLAIGISAITSLMVVAVQKYGSIGAAVQALTGGLSALAEVQRDVNKAFAEAEGKAQGEIASLRALLSVARDNTISKSAQQEALDKLNKEYDKYLPKLTQENKNTQAVNDAVNTLTESLIRQAKIKGLESVITKIATKQAEILSGNLEDNANWLDHITSALKSGGTAGAFAFNLQQEGAKRAGKDFEKYGKQLDFVNKLLINLTKKEAVAGTLFTDTSKIKTPKAAKLTLDKPEITLKDPMFTQVRWLDRMEPIDVAGVTKSEKGGFGASALESMKQSAAEAKKVLTDLMTKAEELGAVLTNTLGTAFTNLFDDIFSGSKNAFQAFGQAIAAIIKKLAAAAVTAAIFALIISAVTGGTSAAAQGGGFLKNFKGIFGNMSGLGNIFGGIAAPSGGANVRGIANRGQGGGQLTAVVRGQDLIFVLSRASAQQGRLT